MLYDRANCFSAFWFSVKCWTWLPFDPLSQPKQPKPNQLFTHSWLHSGIIFQIMKFQCRVIKRLGWCQRVDYRAAWRKELDLLLISFSWGSSPLVLLGGETQFCCSEPSVVWTHNRGLVLLLLVNLMPKCVEERKEILCCVKKFLKEPGIPVLWPLEFAAGQSVWQSLLVCPAARTSHTARDRQCTDTHTRHWKTPQLNENNLPH